MACPTYSLSATQRSKLQSSVKQAAYRHAEKYVDELYGKTQNFTSKAHQEEVQSLGMFVPFGEEMPLTIAEAWNAAERAEKKINSVVGRVHIVALPHELTREQAVELAVEYTTELVARHRTYADTAIHWKDGNWHMHIGESDRRYEGGEFTEKVREMSEGVVGKAGTRGSKTKNAAGELVATKGSQEIEWMRSTWGWLCTAALENSGSDDRVDMRSYARQGLDKVPGEHKGIKIYNKEQNLLKVQKKQEQLRVRQQKIAALQKVMKKQKNSAVAEALKSNLPDVPFVLGLTLSKQLAAERAEEARQHQVLLEETRKRNELSQLNAARQAAEFAAKEKAKEEEYERKEAERYEQEQIMKEELEIARRPMRELVKGLGNRPVDRQTAEDKKQQFPASLSPTGASETAQKPPRSRSRGDGGLTR